METSHTPKSGYIRANSAIATPQLYYAVYGRVRRAAERGFLPLVTLRAGSLSWRQTTMRWGIEDARTIPPHSSRSTSNRLSGLRPSGEPGPGALYCGTPTGVMREWAHYLPTSRTFDRSALTRAAVEGPDTSFTGSSHRYHGYENTTELVLADVRASSESLHALLDAMRAERAFTKELGDAKPPSQDLITLLLHGRDYSVARAFADAVFDTRDATGVCGVAYDSARSDGTVDALGEPLDGLCFHGGVSGIAGTNHVFFGADGEKLGFLRPIASVDDVAQMMKVKVFTDTGRARAYLQRSGLFVEI